MDVVPLVEHVGGLGRGRAHVIVDDEGGGAAEGGDRIQQVDVALHGHALASVQHVGNGLHESGMRVLGLAGELRARKKRGGERARFFLPARQ